MKLRAMGFIAVIILSCSLLVACQPQSSQLHLEATSAANGETVTQGRALKFPDDHNAHPEFGIEWWYFTANLQDSEGEPVWLQWTLFRYRQPDAENLSQSPWSNNQSYMAHASIHTLIEHAFEERFARGGVGNAGVSIRPYNAFLDDWQFLSNVNDSLFPGELNFTIRDEAQIRLQLHTQASPVLHGNNGYSLKYPGSQYASYYYSQPFIQVSGTIDWLGESKTVTGNAWYDHEWSSQLLGGDFTGWDWFSMHLQGNQKLMLFTLKSESPDKPSIWHGSYLDEKGRQFNLTDAQITVTDQQQMQVHGKRFTQQWLIEIPDYGLELSAEVVKQDQYNTGLFSYYEGAIVITGSHHGAGFVEMTGAD